KSSVGQLTFCASARADALANRGTGCTNCARPDLWGAWLGNRWAYPDKWMIAAGMWVQALGICLIAAAPSLVHDLKDNFWLWIAGAVLLGLGTALVYPTLLAAIGDVVHLGGVLWQLASTGCGAISAMPSGRSSLE
ncbi:MAG TPA: hypothetical protein VJ124_19150, partial [Pyrinomonadaceae bacterium]|nr:hypothetical protein [Pyrinomonadaceae bacterium]